MVPDVSADADPNTGYNIVLHGQQTVIGEPVRSLRSTPGFCLVRHQTGFITPELWANELCFNDITQGNNGAYRAGPGPDPCTGIGSPIGNQLEPPGGKPDAQSEGSRSENEQLREQIARLTEKITNCTAGPRLRAGLLFSSMSR